MTMHLTSEELVDIAEGTRSENSAPHLAGCHVCREQLVDLQSMLGNPELTKLQRSCVYAFVKEIRGAERGRV